MKNLFKIFFVLVLFFGCSSSKNSAPVWYNNEKFLKALQFADFRDITGFIYASEISLKGVDENGNTPLTIVVARTSDEQLVKALIEAGVDINAVNDEGYTALLLAAKDNFNPNITKTILMTGTDIEQKDSAGRTPLLLAARYNKNKNVALLLLEAGARDRQDENFIRAVNANPNFTQQDKNLLLNSKIDLSVKIPWYNSKEFKKALTSNTGELATVAARTDLTAQDPVSKKDAVSLLEENKNPQLLDIFAKNGVNLNTPDQQGKTMLHKAAQQGDTAWLKSLLQAKANPNTRAKDGTVPLYSAITNQPENKENILLLLKAGADKEVRLDRQGNTLLSKLIEDKADIKFISFLIKQGADVNAPNALGDTPLIQAARYAQDEKLINLLLENKADINSQNKQGFTPLLTAAATNKNPQITLALLKKAGSKIDNDHVLEFAQQNPNKEVATKAAQYILEQETAKKNANDKNDSSIWFNNKTLVSAIKTNNTAVIKKEISKQLNLEALIQGQVNALMLAAAFSKTREPIDLLVKAGAKINSTNNGGDTPLMTAAITNKNLPVLQALIDAGANVNAADYKGNTIIMVAASKNPNEKVPVFLIKNGANVDNTKILLQYAQANPNKKVYEILKQLFTVQKKPSSKS